MKRMIVLALAVVGMCMATTASASANLFHASKTGKLLGLSEGTQVFTTSSGGTAVKCEHAATTGTVTALLALHQLVTVVYTKCTVEGFPADITPAQFLLSADGLAAVENTITIVALLPVILGGTCTIKVGPQDLGTSKYDKDPLNSAALLQLAAVTGITSTGSGGACGTGELIGGTYTGNNLIILDGGSLSWL